MLVADRAHRDREREEKNKDEKLEGVNLNGRLGSTGSVRALALASSALSVTIHTACSIKVNQGLAVCISVGKCGTLRW
jgi:hypothetical protein